MNQESRIPPKARLARGGKNQEKVNSLSPIIHNSCFIIHSQRGFSVIEVILAGGMFLTFATVAVTAVLQGFDVNRLGAEVTIANQFASEGIEAVKSIKNQSYSNLITPNPTPRAIVTPTPGGSLMFGADGSSNILNSGKNYTRTIKIESVIRDAAPPLGNIIPTPTPGFSDPDIKKVTSTVNWSFNTARPESISLTAYLSDWRKSLAFRGGILVYGEGININPRVRNYNLIANNFSPEGSTVDGEFGRTYQVKTSPTKQEAIAGYASGINGFRIMCYNGSTWTNEWIRGPAGAVDSRFDNRFDIAYETNSGDVMVLYTTGATSNEVGYRTKPGTAGCGTANWTPESKFDSNNSTVVTYIRMASDRRLASNLIGALYVDDNLDLWPLIWDGSNWVRKPTAIETALETVGVSSTPNILSFDLEYESGGDLIGGDLMAVWGQGGSSSTNGAWYSTCPGGVATCTWGPKTAITDMENVATTLDISANPNTDEIVFASIGDSGLDLQAAYWNGSEWEDSNGNDIDPTCAAPAANTKLVATGWLIYGSTTRSIIVYADSTATNIGWFVGDGGSFTLQADCSTPTCSPAFAAQSWYDIQMDPFNKNQLMLTVADVNSDIFAKRLELTSTYSNPALFTWTNSDSRTALEDSVLQYLASPFSFAYWR